MILRFIAFYLAGADSYTLRTDFAVSLRQRSRNSSGIGARRRARPEEHSLGTWAAGAIFGNHAFRTDAFLATSDKHLSTRLY